MTKPDTNNEEKKVISIYQIDAKLKNLNSIQKNAWETIQEIVCNCKYNAEEKFFKNDFLSNYDRKCYKLSSFSPVGWKNYVEKFLDSPLDISNTKSFSILLLIKPKEQFDNIYAITFGNLAYFVIQNYIDTSFGLDILSRIIDPNLNIVKSSKGQNVVGSTQGQLSIYRQLHALSDIEDFGRIFQELNASIRKDVLEQFGIKTEKDFKNCCAKASFQIKTSVSSGVIEKYIQGCEFAKTLPAQPINSSRQLDKKKDKELIDKIIKTKVQRLWQELQQQENIDLCHKDFDKYINAESYKCKYKRREVEISLGDSLSDIIKLFDIKNDDFENFLKKGHITSYNEDSKLVTQDIIFNHLFLEHVEKNEGLNQKYFILNGEIYKLQEPFIESLNNKIKNYIHKNLFIIEPSLKQWQKDKTETEFNELFEQENNTIVIHPYKYKNIELCDLIKYDENELYMYFVKDEFKSNIRELSYQVYNTAKIIENDINSNYEILKNFYDAFTSIYPDKININKSEFINLFATKNIRYVFAFRDKNNQKIYENPEQFSSNIAKFALVDLVQKMNFIDKGSLKIEQIEYV